MLSPSQIESYDRDGFLCPLTVLPPADLSRFQAGFAELEAELGQEVRRMGQPHLYFPWAYDLATHPRVLDAVEGLLGPTILVSGTLILCKPPGDPGYVAWHQDSVYSGWHLTPTTSAWIALSPSVKENGCMRVIPGSNRDGLRQHDEGHHGDNMLQRGEEVRVEVDESLAHYLALQPGEMSLHGSNIIHGSGQNLSDTKRIGFIVRYVTPAHHQLRGGAMLLARGETDVEHLEILRDARPRYDTAEGLRRWRQADF
jgi:phytanoyl-CoA dioxygenase PhyH